MPQLPDSAQHPDSRREILRRYRLLLQLGQTIGRLPSRDALAKLGKRQ